MGQKLLIQNLFEKQWIQKPQRVMGLEKIRIRVAILAGNKKTILD